MSSTFGGAAFGERHQSGMFPRFGREAVYTLHHVPGSNTTILQRAGRTADMLTVEALCTGAQLTALLALVDSTAGLVYSGGTRSAYLAKLTPLQVGVKDAYFVTLEFVGR